MDNTANIINQILEQGYYEEEVEVLPNFKVILKTRTHAEEYEIRQKLAEANLEFKSMLDFTFFNTHYTLPNSIKKIGEIVLPDSYDERKQLLDRLPQPLYAAIAQAFIDFEKKVYDAMNPETIKK